jgi:glucose dehydrogenase
VDQLDPRALCDFDEINENVLVAVPTDGQTKRALIRSGRNGFA